MSHPPLKLIWLTDLYLVEQGGRVCGYDPNASLDSALDYIKTFHQDADYCVLTGDLADHGKETCYHHLDKRFHELNLPYLAIPGNHDCRDAMGRGLSHASNPLPSATDPNHFIQFSVVENGVRLIGLDTLHPGFSTGEYCEARWQWLEQQLSDDPDTPVVVFCHHHPAELHLPMQDGERLADGDTLVRRLCDAPQIRHLFFGHVHRPVSGCFQTLPFTALQSATLQAELPYPPWNWDNFRPANESPALGIIHLTENSVVCHFHPFCGPDAHFASAV